MNNTSIRVLMVMDSLAVGGTETHVHSLLKPLREKGVNVVYAGAGGVMYEPYMRAGCAFYRIDLTPTTLMKEGSAPKAIHALKQVMIQRKIDVVHVHQTPSGLLAVRAAHELGIAAVFTAHGAYYAEEQLQELKQYCQTIISVSKPVQAHLLRMGIASELVPNGIDTELFYPGEPASLRRQLGIPANAQLVLYASRLAWDKAVVCTILMMAISGLHTSGMPDLHLVIAGDGIQAGEIRTRMETIHSESGKTFIHMAGNQTQIRNYYTEADLVVGTGRVALEAMACSKPVLAIGNHGYLGLVTPDIYTQAWEQYFGDHASPGKASEEKISEAIRLAFADREGLRAIGENGRGWVDREFNAARLGERIVQIYKRALERVRQLRDEEA